LDRDVSLKIDTIVFNTFLEVRFKARLYELLTLSGIDIPVT